MSNYSANIEKVKDVLKKQNYYESIESLMSWDLWQGQTVDGREYREEVTGYFIKDALQLLTSEENKKIANYFKELGKDDYDNIYDRAAARVFLKKYRNAVDVPVELQIEMQNFTSKAQMVWREALAKSDFNMYKPYLKELFELKKRYAETIDNSKNPFDILVDEVDEGLSVEETSRLFAELRDGIVNILQKIENTNVEINEECLNFEYNKEELKTFGINMLKMVGFDLNKGSFAEVLHPVCTSTGPKDSRVTCNYSHFVPALFSLLHEGGHAMYNYRSNDKVVEYGLWGGVGGAAHESQSRFYENIIGRSYEFWQYIYPMVQKSFPYFKNIDLDTYYKAINKVQPTLRRLDADELTYSLHPIIRFEMEKEYFDGKLKTDDFYEVWNQKYKDYLGIEPKNAQEGVLQDVHWASGHIGYFQSYTLGNLWDGQIRAKMLHDTPNMYEEIGRGNFDPVNNWLTDKIHQYGSVYTPNETLLNSTGEQLKSKYFIDYLDNKYSKIYGYNV